MLLNLKKKHTHKKQKAKSVLARKVKEDVWCYDGRATRETAGG